MGKKPKEAKTKRAPSDKLRQKASRDPLIEPSILTIAERLKAERRTDRGLTAEELVEITKRA